MIFPYAIFLGILQGLTEFLPISSSGHLVLMELFLGIKEAGLAFDVFLHMGTLVGVLVYFRRDFLLMITALLQPRLLGEEAGFQRRLAFYICLGAIPAAVAGLFLKHSVETVFRSPYIIACTLAGGGLLLLVADMAGKHMRDTKSVRWTDALFIGILQIFALVPGVSRSGITMTAGLLLGLNRMSAARYSFLLSVPVIFGAGILNLPDIVSQGIAPGQTGFYLSGFAAAAVSGYLVIAFLLRFVQTHSFAVFAFYRFLVAVVVLLTQII